MNLKEFYDINEVPKSDRIKFEKNILVVTPIVGYNLKPFLKALELDSHEVAVTYPKDNISLLEEIKTANAKYVLQVGEKKFDEYDFISKNMENLDTIKKEVRNYICDYYVNLHHKDEYSIREGLGTVKDLMKIIKSTGSNFCCVTNSCFTGGWIKQYEICIENGVKPIFGMELFIDNFVKSEDPEDDVFRPNDYSSLTAWAITEEGFYNILKIHNEAQLKDYFGGKPRVNDAVLKKYGKGIAVGTGDINGEIPKLLLDGELDEAVERYDFYNECFDEVYIEIPLIENIEQWDLNETLVLLAKELDAKAIISPISYYLHPEHEETHHLLMLMKEKKTIEVLKYDQNKAWQFTTHGLYYRSYDSMKRLWEDGFYAEDENEDMTHYVFKDDEFDEEFFEQCCYNTRMIAVNAETIQLDSTVKLPVISEDSAQVLIDECRKGMKLRCLEGKQEYEDRLEHEIGVINHLGWPDYFLVMQKIVDETKEKYGEASVGHGRGSAAGALVSYCLGITNIDPLEHDLLFERFLDESRQTVSALTFEL